MLKLVKTAEHLVFNYVPIIPEEGISHVSQCQLWQDLQNEFEIYISRGHKFLAPRIFIDEFTPYADSKIKIYGIYCSLLNMERKEFNAKRRLLGVVPPGGKQKIVNLNFIYSSGDLHEALAVCLGDLLELEQGEWSGFCKFTNKTENFVGTLFHLAGDYPGIAEAIGLLNLLNSFHLTYTFEGFKNVQSNKKCHFCLVGKADLAKRYDSLSMPLRDERILLQKIPLLEKRGKILATKKWFDSQSLKFDVCSSHYSYLRISLIVIIVPVAITNGNLNPIIIIIIRPIPAPSIALTRTLTTHPNPKTTITTSTTTTTTTHYSSYSSSSSSSYYLINIVYCSVLQVLPSLKPLIF